MPLWTYRRIIDKALFEPGFYESDITLVNWPQNDYYLGPIIGVSEAEKRQHLENAKQLSFSLLYWLQTEMPRPDGGKGYPGLRLRTDVLGTEDGMAKTPYIRESRRIKARYTITEADVGKEMRERQEFAATPTASAWAAIIWIFIRQRSRTASSTFLVIHMRFRWAPCCLSG